jgi:Holliday junction DNA helicase RuvA
LLLELKGKLADALPGATGATSAAAQVTRDALNALMALGYSDKEAAPALKQLPEDLSLEESIRQALKLLAKK